MNKQTGHWVYGRWRIIHWILREGNQFSACVTLIEIHVLMAAKVIHWNSE